MKKTISEADLIFEFAFQLRLRNIEFRLEHRIEDCRFDLVIIRNNQLSEILEFKRITNRSSGKKSRHVNQLEKYKRHGIKLHWIWSKLTFKRALFEITGSRNLLVARSKNCIISEIEA